MEKVNWKLSGKLGSHWIKVKFYQEEPEDKDAKRLKDVKFCQATKLAVIHPVILDKTSINCAGAHCAFGWSDSSEAFLKNCREKNNMPLGTLQSILSRADYFKKSVAYIGLNTAGIPDLVLSYVSPEQAMAIVKIYQLHTGKNLDTSLCSMMSICGSVAVRAHLTKEITFSFGCEESRRSASLGKENLAVGIPQILFGLFVDGQ
ncbi:MAG: DUF169 domain-containing protein [Candidatus Omnitrophica bacterium]|nr:DUF169 domain-containing protein [Candidatus Omnitrophota bacterium]